ncbi:MAG: hypothetical protein HKP34_07480 [Nitrosopumilus sp.]|nr:hypothetical protein [Nitrosopumilus sp.]NNL38125.1 hypothetical protein [Nitrosopumilus sp.]
MNIEKSIEKCEIYLKKIKQYDPDPFYVNYFFNEYIISINDTIKGIFEEANRDFGLFVTKEVSEKSFFEKAKVKNDLKAIEFSEWYSAKFIEEHKKSFPDFINKVNLYKNRFQKLPEIKIMIRASERFKDDVNQQIIVNLSNMKLRSKKELDIEIKRQLPIFLEIINHKRKKNDEPKVDENQITASTFMDVGNSNDVEIAYAAEIYIPVLKRLVEESKKKILELTKLIN